MLKRLLLPVAAASLVFVAVPAQATTFQLDQFTVNLHQSDPGLVMSEADILTGPLQFDLNQVGDTFSQALFWLGTSETALNLDDVVPYGISVALDFSLPDPGFSGSAYGLTGAAWFFQSFGYVVWDNPLQIAFGNTGLLAVSLSDGTFGLPGKTPIGATFTLLRADTGSGASPVPEPSSLALLGIGLAGLAASRRRRAA